MASPSRAQLTVTSAVSCWAPIASRPPMSPEVTVIEKTAARVITSHLLTASGGEVMPSGRFAVLKTVFQTRRRWANMADGPRGYPGRPGSWC